jgi:uncharacterized protein (TIGR02145 family)
MKEMFVSFYFLFFQFVLMFAQTTQDDVVKDIDGNIYTTKNFGGVTWMVEDLKVTRYRNTQKITFTNSPKSWSEHNRQVARNCDKNKDVIYNWFVVIDVRKVCPVGWKIPSEKEWNDLSVFLDANRMNDSLIQKNSSFLPRYNGNFDVLTSLSSSGKSSFWWSLNENSELSAWGREMTTNNFQLIKGHADKRDGLSIRCVKEK